MDLTYGFNLRKVIYLHGGEAQPRELKAGTAVQLDNPQQDQGQAKEGHHSGP